MSTGIKKLPSISEIIHAGNDLLALLQFARGNISGAWSWHRGQGHRSLTVSVPRHANTTAAFCWGIKAFLSFRQCNCQLSGCAAQTGGTNTRPCRTASERLASDPGACWAPSRVELKHLTHSTSWNTQKGKNPLMNRQVSPNCKRPPTIPSLQILKSGRFTGKYNKSKMVHWRMTSYVWKHTFLVPMWLTVLISSCIAVSSYTYITTTRVWGKLHLFTLPFAEICLFVCFAVFCPSVWQTASQLPRILVRAAATLLQCHPVWPVMVLIL